MANNIFPLSVSNSPDRTPSRDPRRRPFAMTVLGVGVVGLVGLTVFAIADNTRMTKPEIALGLLDLARQWGVPIQAVVVDAGYGDNPNFLTG